MTADEDIDRAGGFISRASGFHDLLDLQPGSNIEVVADVTSLKIEI